MLVKSLSTFVILYTFTTNKQKDSKNENKKSCTLGDG